MFDTETVRRLCARLLEEDDPDRFEELVDTLHTIVESNVDQARLKMGFVARHYPELLSRPPKPKSGKTDKHGWRLYILR